MPEAYLIHCNYLTDGSNRLPAWQLDDMPEAYLIHCNYLTDGEVAAIAERPHLTIVYCPRTHAYFEHPPHRWQEIIARGGKVVLGTDGRSSNPDLSILAEAKFLVRKHAESSPLEILQMILPNSKPQQQRRLGQFQFYDLQTDAVSCPIQRLLQ